MCGDQNPRSHSLGHSFLPLTQIIVRQQISSGPPLAEGGSLTTFAASTLASAIPTSAVATTSLTATAVTATLTASSLSATFAASSLASALAANPESSRGGSRRDRLLMGSRPRPPPGR